MEFGKGHLKTSGFFVIVKWQKFSLEMTVWLLRSVKQKIKAVSILMICWSSRGHCWFECKTEENKSLGGFHLARQILLQLTCLMRIQIIMQRLGTKAILRVSIFRVEQK